MLNRIFFVQLLAVILCSFLSAYFFDTFRNARDKDFRKETRHEISVIHDQVKEVQNGLSKVFRDMDELLGIFNSLEEQNSYREPSNYQPEEFTDQLNQMWDRTNAFQETIAMLSRRLQNVEQSHRSERTENGAWFNDLAEEKRGIVQEIYQQELAIMREKISLSPDGIAPSTEEMMEAIQESQEILRERLRDVLNDGEYQAFLESMPSGPMPSVPQPIP